MQPGKRSIGPIPDCPCNMFSKNESGPIPQAETIPKPVIAIRSLIVLLASNCLYVNMPIWRVSSLTSLPNAPANGIEGGFSRHPLRFFRYFSNSCQFHQLFGRNQPYRKAITGHRNRSADFQVHIAFALTGSMYDSASRLTVKHICFHPFCYLSSTLFIFRLAGSAR